MTALFNADTPLEELETIRESLQGDRDVMDYIQDPRHRKIEKQIASLRGIDELKELSKDTTIYIVERTPTTFHAYYIKDNNFLKIWIPSEMQKSKTYGYVFSRGGGGYSKTHDIVYHLGYLIHNDGYYFKDTRV
tara:strand:- start:142 stop:543 length:402 start_codon:yes stop_codon:yes gene_type:complete